jgi:mannose-6-phosphate isomerase-like protein (cupin superfamily)
MELVKDFGAVAGGTPGPKPRKVNLFETARFFADVLVLMGGQEQKPHAHAESDKVYAVLAGAGVVRVGGVPHPVGAGKAVMCPAGVEHSIENLGFEEMRVLVFMAPHPKPPA